MLQWARFRFRAWIFRSWAWQEVGRPFLQIAVTRHSAASVLSVLSRVRFALRVGSLQVPSSLYVTWEGGGGVSWVHRKHSKLLLGPCERNHRKPQKVRSLGFRVLNPKP